MSKRMVEKIYYYILIDDLPSNIRAWEECGGTGIHHISPEKGT